MLVCMPLDQERQLCPDEYPMLVLKIELGLDGKRLKMSQNTCAIPKSLLGLCIMPIE